MEDFKLDSIKLLKEININKSKETDKISNAVINGVYWLINYTLKYNRIKNIADSILLCFYTLIINTPISKELLFIRDISIKYVKIVLKIVIQEKIENGYEHAYIINKFIRLNGELENKLKKNFNEIFKKDYEIITLEDYKNLISKNKVEDICYYIKILFTPYLLYKYKYKYKHNKMFDIKDFKKKFNLLTSDILDRFRKYDSFETDYLVTHIFFVLNCYGICGFNKWTKPVLKICKLYIFKYFSSMFKTKDIDLLAEVVSCLKLCSKSSKRDKIIKKSISYILKKQKKNGSWYHNLDNVDQYDVIHPIWTCINALYISNLN